MNPRFLIVDDDPDVLGVLGSMLTSLGCESEGILSGSEALQRLSTPDEAAKFDAIFLDVMMPELTGFQVLEKLRTTDHTAELPVVLLTSLGDAEKK